MENGNLNTKIQERQEKEVAKMQLLKEKEERKWLADERRRAILDTPDRRAKSQAKIDAKRVKLEVKQEKRVQRQARMVGNNVLRQLKRGYITLPAKSSPILFGNPGKKTRTWDSDYDGVRMSERSRGIVKERLKGDGVEVDFSIPIDPDDHEMIFVQAIDGKPTLNRTQNRLPNPTTHIAKIRE